MNKTGNWILRNIIYLRNIVSRGIHVELSNAA